MKQDSIPIPELSWSTTMPLRCRILVYTLWLSIVGGPALAGPHGSDIFPQSTRLYVSTPSIIQLGEHVRTTQFGRLADDPQMRPFMDAWRQQTGDGTTRALLPWDDVTSVAAGGVSMAVCELAERRRATVILVNVARKEPEVAALLSLLVARFGSRNRTTSIVAGTRVEHFTLPASEDTGGVAMDRFYFEKDDLFCATDSGTLVEDLLGNWGQASPARLCDHKAFRFVVDNSMKCIPSDQADVVWFVDPLRAARLVPPARTDQTQPIWERLGFDAVLACGGVVAFSRDTHDAVYHAAIYAPGPYRRAARALVFPPSDALPVPDWVPADVDGFVSIQWDFPALLQGLGSWFDEEYGEGEEGVFEGVLQDVRNDPGGPGVDVSSDVVAQLVGPVTIVTASTDVLYAARVRNEPTVAVAVERMFQGDSDVQRTRIGDHVVWAFRDQNAAQESGSEPAVDPPAPSEMFGPDLSNYAICVADGRLFIATDRALLERFLQHDRSAQGLAGQPDFQTVLEGLRPFATDGSTGWQFARLADTVRPTFEALRAGKREGLGILGSQIFAWQGNSLSADTGLSQTPSPAKASRFELLPPFNTIRQHLMSAGTVTTELPDGWRLSGIVLARPAQEATDETR